MDQEVAHVRVGLSVESPSRDDNERAAVREWDRSLERLADELTGTAYAVALQHGAGGTWVDLELGLWEALARTVREWDRSSPRAEGLPPSGSGSDRPPPVSVLHQEQE